MFASKQWKKRVEEKILQLEAVVQDLKKTEVELKLQNQRLVHIVKNLGRKLVMRFPISVESLEKGLSYDLIFSDEINAWQKVATHGTILDLRSRVEYLKGSVPGARNLPVDELSLRLESLSKDQPILLICENGIRSVSVSELLYSKGYPYLYVLKGGMNLYHGPLIGPGDERIERLEPEESVRQAQI